MKEKFLDYVGTNGKSYSWANGCYTFRIELKPLNDWEMLSLGGGIEEIENVQESEKLLQMK